MMRKVRAGARGGTQCVCGAQGAWGAHTHTVAYGDALHGPFSLAPRAARLHPGHGHHTHHLTACACFLPTQHGSNLDFEVLNGMDVLHRNIMEALRMNPPLVLLLRYAKQPFTVTTSTGKEYTVPKVRARHATLCATRGVWACVRVQPHCLRACTGPPAALCALCSVLQASPRAHNTHMHAHARAPAGRRGGCLPQLCPPAAPRVQGAQQVSAGWPLPV